MLRDGDHILNLPSSHSFRRERHPHVSRSRSASSCCKVGSRRNQQYEIWRRYFNRRVRKSSGRFSERPWTQYGERNPILGSWTITVHRIQRQIRPFLPLIARWIFVLVLALDARNLIHLGGRCSRTTMEHLTLRERLVLTSDVAVGTMGVLCAIAFASGRLDSRTSQGLVVYTTYRSVRFWQVTSNFWSALAHYGGIANALWLMRLVKRRRRVRLSELEGKAVHIHYQSKLADVVEADIAMILTRLNAAIIVFDHVCAVGGRGNKAFSLLGLPFVVILASGYGATANCVIAVLALPILQYLNGESAFFRCMFPDCLATIASLLIVVHGKPNTWRLDEAEENYCLP